MAETNQSFFKRVFPFLDSSSKDEAILALQEQINKMQAEGYIDPQLLALSKEFSEALKQNRTISSGMVASAYAAVYTKVANTRRKLIREVDQISMFYLVDVIVSQLVEDSLSPEIGTGKVLRLKGKSDEIQKEIDMLVNKYLIDSALPLAVTPDIIKYGEYYLGTKVNPSKENSKEEQPKENIETKENIYDPGTDGRMKALLKSDNPSKSDGVKGKDEYGLTDLTDDVDQTSVIALTTYGDTEGYIHEERPLSGILRKKEPADFIRFALSSQRVRVDLAQEFNISPEKLREIGIPRFLRVGKSIIHPILSKLKELELLEAMVPATKLSKMSNGSLVGVQVPAGYDIEKAIEAAKKVEGTLNSKIGVDMRSGEMTVERITSAAGRYKVVPLFGDKGSLQRMDYQTDEPDELLNTNKDLRETILSSAGIPAEIVFGGDGTTGREMLKKYSRYLRRLKAIQKAVEEGIRQIIYIHLVNKGIKFTAEDVTIEFCNKLIEIDNLDKLEYMDTTIGMINNIKQFVFDMANPEINPGFAKNVRVKEFITFLNTQLNIIGFNNLIDIDNVGKEKDADGLPNTPPSPDATGNYLGPNATPAGAATVAATAPVVASNQKFRSTNV